MSFLVVEQKQEAQHLPPLFPDADVRVGAGRDTRKGGERGAVGALGPGQAKAPVWDDRRDRTLAREAEAGVRVSAGGKCRDMGAVRALVPGQAEAPVWNNRRHSTLAREPEAPVRVRTGGDRDDRALVGGQAEAPVGDGWGRRESECCGGEGESEGEEGGGEAHGGRWRDGDELVRWNSVGESLGCEMGNE